MISLLRKIRKSLLNPNSLQKYSIYAVGEIFLVVIGILLALQINNWNQKRINNQIEEDYLERFLFDLKRDSLINSNSIDILRAKNENLRKVRYLLEVPETPLNDSVMVILRSSCSAGHDLPNARLTGTYEEIISSGHLRLLDNADLRKWIIRHYTEWDHTDFRIRNKQSDYLSHLYKIIDLGITPDEIQPFFEKDPLYSGKTLYDVLQFYDMEKSFKSNLMHEINYSLKAINLLEWRERNIENLKEDIRNELVKKS